MHPFAAKRFVFPVYVLSWTRTSLPDDAFVQRAEPVDISLRSTWSTRILRVFAAAVVFMCLLLGAFPSAASSIGLVKVAAGSATVQRGDETLQAQPGLALEEEDILRTGADGRMGVVLRDDSRLSLGPDSEVQIAHFAFAPAQGRLALVAKIARGVIAFISGTIAKLSQDAVRIETPVAILGVRGTQLLARVETP
jgi:hypothetical protein